ncbi:serine protease [Persicitalea sp.]|uniref:trypsin-like serine peptidase n=1 Tax=Persicitalea sp. TaxID=3100273 RepID=UPI0035935F94
MADYSKAKKGDDKIEPPFSPEELKKEMKSEKARAKLDVSTLDINLLTGNLNIPPGTSIERIGMNVSDNLNEIDLRVKVPEFGKYHFPKDIEQKFVGKDDFVIDPDGFTELPPFRPDHLALDLDPGDLPRSFTRSKKYFEKLPDKEDLHYATTIFGADNRQLFLNSSYPWGTVGKVRTALGSGSGVMIGPRHLLTVSHVIQWTSNGAGWISFTPASFDGSAPFGTAWGTRIYYRVKVTGPTINRNEGQHDYVVVVLDRRMGNLTGWMGAKSWTDSWDNSPYWSHVGYPADLNSGARPCYQGSIPMDGSFWDADRHTRIFHQGDVFPGQSGGPYFAWWSNGPHAVAVQSGQTSSQNSASGGSEMVDLVVRARNDFP